MERRRRHRPSTTSRSIYSHPYLYRLGMRLVYRSEYRQRYAMLAEQIAAPSQVLEVCCGDLVLHTVLERRGFLRSYQGLEINPGMLALARKRNVPVKPVDVRTSHALPKAEVVIMQASLYQFHGIAESLLARLWAAAERQLIIAEPVRSLSSSPNAFVRWLGRLASRTEDEVHLFRYTEADLVALYARCGIPITRMSSTSGGRELVISSMKKHTGDGASHRDADAPSRSASAIARRKKAIVQANGNPPTMTRRRTGPA